MVALANARLAESIGSLDEHLDSVAELVRYAWQVDTIDGLLLDRLVNRDQTRRDAAAAAFADLLEQVQTHPGPGQRH